MIQSELYTRPDPEKRKIDGRPLYVLDIGPSNTSSFHAMDTFFDHVWLEGTPGDQLRGSQTVLFGSSNSAIVESMHGEDDVMLKAELIDSKLSDSLMAGRQATSHDLKMSNSA